MAVIYLYVHDLRASGVVRNALRYATRLANDGHDVALVAGSAEGLWFETAGAGAFRLVALGQRAAPWPRLGNALRLRRWLRSQPPGLVASLGNHGHASAYLATRALSRFPRLYRISNAVLKKDGWRDRWRTWWMRRLIADARRIVCVGAGIGAAPVFERALAAGKAVIVANGVDIPAARESARAPCPHPWLEADEPVILGIGRLRPQKNFDLLISAAASAVRERPLRLILLGGGTSEERQRLQAVADRHGFGNRMLLAGETDNVFTWLARASLFALPSRWEGSSMALLEAMAVDTPVAAAREAGDAAMVLTDGRHGTLFDADDPESLTRAIVRQLGPDVIRPGDRIQDFSAEDALDTYARIFREAAE